MRELKDKGLPPDTLLNVNVPDLAERRGLRDHAPGQAPLRRRGRSRRTTRAAASTTGSAATELDFDDEPGTDFTAIHQGLVSVTPLHLDLTNYESLRTLERTLRLDWP